MILELIHSSLENAGPVFLTKHEFTQAITDNFLDDLLKNSLSSEKPVFTLSFGIIVSLINYFRDKMKHEVSSFLESVF